MKKGFLLVLFIGGLAYCSSAQTAPAPALYHPEEDADKAITAAIKQAKAENKHVLIQAGGNWCGWCIKFEHFCNTDFQLDSLLKKDFVVYHLNYSKENFNKPLFARYGYAQRFGFPVFIILDENGTRIHTQNSAYLEKDKSYDKEKLMEFLESWNRKALDPSVYINF